MKVRLQKSNVRDSVVLSMWNIFRKQNSSLSSEDQFDFANSDAASRNREAPISTVQREAFGLLKICIQLTNTCSQPWIKVANF